MFSMYFHQFLGLRKTFPAELLYAPESKCGVGLPRFSNEAHGRKLAVLFRGFQSDTETQNAASSLLLRGLRIQNVKPTYTQYAILKPNSFTQPLFVHSIAEWLDLADIRLAKGGQVFEHCSFTSVVNFFNDMKVQLTEEQTCIL